MSLNFDPSHDLSHIADGVERVTLLRRRSTIGADGEIIAHAIRRAISSAEAAIITSGDVRKTVAGDGYHTATAVVWHLPTAELTKPPRLGDVILDRENQRWTILEAKLATLGTRWRCETKNVAIAHRLDDTISVLKAANETTWRIWLTGIRARIQPVKMTVTTTESVTTTTNRFRIFVEDDLELSHRCRIRGPDGTIYTILSAAGAERIGELQTIEVETIGY
jgi:hypothetical protein